MKIKIPGPTLAQILISLILAACTAAPAGNAAPAASPAPADSATPAASATANVSPTPDVCSPENVKPEVTKVNDLTRAFDDYAKLSSNVNQNQLLQIIPPMQTIGRQAQSQDVPACLKTFKLLQLRYMDTVVNTLIAFMGAKDSQQITAGIAQARVYHQQYDLEGARLLGITIVPAPTLTHGPAPTPAATGTPTSSPVTATIAGDSAVNLRAAPDINAKIVSRLEKGVTANVTGMLNGGQWVQLEIPGQPGQKAWCYTVNLKINGLKCFLG